MKPNYKIKEVRRFYALSVDPSKPFLDYYQEYVGTKKSVFDGIASEILFKRDRFDFNSDEEHQKFTKIKNRLVRLLEYYYYKNEKENIRLKAEITDKISKILHSDWDPIGCGVPEDEYTSYAYKIYKLMADGCTIYYLAQTLEHYCENVIGVKSNWFTNIQVAEKMTSLLQAQILKLEREM